MRSILFVLAVAALSVMTPGAACAQRMPVNIPAGTAGPAIRALSAQTGVAIGGTLPELERTPTPAVRGRLSADAALKRLLAHTAFRSVRISASAFRIERRPRAPDRTKAPARSPATPVAPGPILAPDVTVTASLRDIKYAAFPASATLIPLRADDPLTATLGLDRLMSSQPVAASTQLGPGRNKLFLRGMADSSFNGPTQATTGLYVGEMRLIYSAPNPDLRLYDVDRVEVLEGPQGTLYGAGTLGGVIRLVPAAPDATSLHGRLWASGQLSQHGAPSGSLAAMINVPVASGTAFRAVGYHEEQGGYIRDRQRGLDNINRSLISGGRAALSHDLGGGWHVSATLLGQSLRTRDGQYIDPRLRGRVRATALAQPFSSDLVAGGVTLKGNVGTLHLTSTTGVVDNDLNTLFDSSALVGPGHRQAFNEIRTIRLIFHESRLNSTGPGPFSWVAGFSLLRNLDDFRQLVTSLDGDSPPPFANIRYRVDEAALFGEGALKLGHGWTATWGGRAVMTRNASRRMFGTNAASENRTEPVRFLPMAALSWTNDNGLLAWLRYQRSYRIGGVTIERAPDGTPILSRFDADSLQSVESGFRLTGTGPAALTLAGTVFYADWRDIQGDLIDQRGFPITRNIGNGNILGLTLSIGLSPVDGVRTGLSLFANHSRIDRAAPDTTITRHNLPNVADLGFTGWLETEQRLGPELTLFSRAQARYVGTSYIDLDPTSQVSQGNYADVGLTLGVRRRQWTLALEGSNLLDIRGNRFALGDPFTAHLEPQATPLQPRRLKIALTIGF